MSEHKVTSEALIREALDNYGTMFPGGYQALARLLAQRLEEAREAMRESYRGLDYILRCAGEEHRIAAGSDLERLAQEIER